MSDAQDKFVQRLKSIDVVEDVYVQAPPAERTDIPSNHVGYICVVQVNGKPDRVGQYLDPVLIAEESTHDSLVANMVQDIAARIASAQ